MGDPESVDPDAPATAEAVVRGRVQGVGFRWFAQREATVLGLSGWVANEPDGSVRCHATGRRASVHAFIERLRAGPPSGSVTSFDLVWLPPPAGGSRTGAIGFVVRSGSHRGD